MRVKFTQPITRTLTLTRGTESIELTLHALPPGWGAAVRSKMQPPMRFVNGKPVPMAEDPEYNDLWGMLLIAKSLEPSGVLETPLAEPWRDTAEKVRAEFHASGLTDGDLQKLAEAMNALSNGSQVQELRGN